MDKSNYTGVNFAAQFTPMLNKQNNSNVTEILDSDKLCFNQLIYYLKTNEFCGDTDFSVENIYNDLEIYRGLESETSSIISKINNTSTIFGYLKFVSVLNKSTECIKELTDRQNDIKKMSNLIDESKIDVYKKLSLLKELEKDVIWLLKPKTVEEQSILNGVYFGGRFFDNFNNFEEPLNIYSYFKIYLSPLYGLLSPLVMMIFPFLYLKFFSKIKINFKVYLQILKMSIFGDVFSSLGTPRTGRSKISKYFSLFLSIVFYIQNLFNSISISRNTNKIINLINSKLVSFQKFCKVGLSLVNELSDELKLTKLEYPIKYLDKNDFSEEHNLFSNKGKILYAAKNLMQYKFIEDLFKSIANIDYLASIKKLIDKFDTCYPKYIDNKTPIIDYDNVYHPYLGKNAIKNSIIIGKSNPANVIITGPNAGGKSTFIKSIALSLLIGQTIGISFSDKLTFTPFKILNSYLNIPDCKGKESLFEAEMHRARDHIENCSGLNENDKSFIIMDEIFSSTNPDEGISGAFAIAEKLSDFKNSACIITTHYNQLTKLDENGKFKNYKIPCIKDNFDKIVYPYKIEEGVSNQNIALELLKAKGFDEALINRANEICSSISQDNTTLKTHKKADEAKVSETEEAKVSESEEAKEEAKEEANDEATEAALLSEEEASQAEEEASQAEEEASQAEEATKAPVVVAKTESNKKIKPKKRTYNKKK